MKMLKSEQEYKYGNFRELQCAVCKKKAMGQRHRIKCSQCSTVYNFEPPRWRVLADVPAPEE
jgi:hypothetical protein